MGAHDTTVSDYHTRFTIAKQKRAPALLGRTMGHRAKPLRMVVITQATALSAASGTAQRGMGRDRTLSSIWARKGALTTPEQPLYFD
jgi:hypothetical protein